MNVASPHYNVDVTFFGRQRKQPKKLAAAPCATMFLLFSTFVVTAQAEAAFFGYVNEVPIVLLIKQGLGMIEKAG